MWHELLLCSLSRARAVNSTIVQDTVYVVMQFAVDRLWVMQCLLLEQGRAATFIAKTLIKASSLPLSSVKRSNSVSCSGISIGHIHDAFWCSNRYCSNVMLRA